MSDTMIKISKSVVESNGLLDLQEVSHKPTLTKIGQLGTTCTVQVMKFLFTVLFLAWVTAPKK